MADAMRAFLAVDLHDTLGAATRDWGRRVSQALSPTLASRLSWVPAERVHVTLRFFGDLPPARADAIVAALAPLPAPPPFDLIVGSAGTFPTHGRPRVLWLGFSHGQDGLVRLHAWTRDRLAGVIEDDRPQSFAPHLTVARVRREAPPGLAAALREAAARTPRPDARARVQAVTLFESVLSAKGPTYVPLVRLGLEEG